MFLPFVLEPFPSPSSRERERKRKAQSTLLHRGEERRAKGVFSYLPTGARFKVKEPLYRSKPPFFFPFARGERRQSQQRLRPETTKLRIQVFS